MFAVILRNVLIVTNPLINCVVQIGGGIRHTKHLTSSLSIPRESRRLPLHNLVYNFKFMNAYLKAVLPYFAGVFCGLLIGLFLNFNFQKPQIKSVYTEYEKCKEAGGEYHFYAFENYTGQDGFSECKIYKIIDIK